MKYQQITLQITASGQTVEGSKKLDINYSKIKSISFDSSLEPAPASIQELSFDDDNKLFESGVKVGAFQSAFKEKNSIDINRKNEETKVVFRVKDETVGSFVPYYIQLLIVLEK